MDWIGLDWIIQLRLLQYISFKASVYLSNDGGERCYNCLIAGAC